MAKSTPCLLLRTLGFWSPSDFWVQSGGGGGGDPIFRSRTRPVAFEPDGGKCGSHRRKLEERHIRRSHEEGLSRKGGQEEFRNVRINREEKEKARKNWSRRMCVISLENSGVTSAAAAMAFAVLYIALNLIQISSFSFLRHIDPPPGKMPPDGSLGGIGEAFSRSRTIRCSRPPSLRQTSRMISPAWIEGQALNLCWTVLKMSGPSIRTMRD